jgi:hypothetical protein
MPRSHGVQDGLAFGRTITSLTLMPPGCSTAKATAWAMGSGAAA